MTETGTSDFSISVSYCSGHALEFLLLPLRDRGVYLVNSQLSRKTAHLLKGLQINLPNLHEHRRGNRDGNKSANQSR